MHEYDTTLKLLLQGSAQRSLRELTGVAVARWLNVELPEIGNKRVNLLGETADGELIHIELQAQNDGSMPLRMAEYCLRIYRHLGKFPRQVVLYVGQEPLRMAAELVGPRLSFGYDLTDIRDIDGEALLASDQVGDNVIAVLTRWRSHGTAVQEIVRKVAELEEDARNFYLGALLELAGLRGIEELVEGEARKMPILMNILDNKVLGREYKRGELAILRRQVEARFGVTAEWLEERLRNRSAVEIEALGVRLLKAESLEEWLK